MEEDKGKVVAWERYREGRVKGVEKREGEGECGGG